ncbi:hypothetical protein CCHL11_06733 [Colletotrichum chlorophyti]|uniref:Heterokaryon incompatibility domain-containing protein n=1 Tax=Colletotrichum chlorophyti TaxID=708187 RepID=A0A1Q8RZ02_9PEZI|nr:hypothetical protein CCHL11_06733 [Colletotrichum chlorophyti]
MPSQCRYCAGLTIETLVELAKTGFEAQEFPQTAYYQHHQSFDDLEREAGNGCEFCQLILNCFLHTPCPEPKPMEWPLGWNRELDLKQETQPRTMYSIAKELAVSDVKLCINATHLYGRQPLEDAEVLDEILVQVGPLYAETEDGYGIWSCPILHLSLGTSRENPARIGRLRIGRYEVDSNVGSTKNFALAREWLSSCRNSHVNCLSHTLRQLPTRVIDVGELQNDENVRLFLTNGMKADYIALSHCWGGAISPLLTAQTLMPFQTSIAISDLPANFRDAIIITRQLGIRYLWIDSLCIQQDSKSDWEVESKKMGTVYRNSTITISAMTSGGSKEGILNHNPKPRNSEPKASVRVFNTREDKQEVTARRRDPSEENLRSLERDSALATRGWTLQEYILSPRHILYGKNAVYWKCPQEFISPDGLPQGNKSPQTSYSDLVQVIYSDILNQPQTKPPDIDVILRDYYELLNAYTQRKLTYGSDKLPAFSGLAQRLHPAIGGDYLVGLWTEDFRRGLLWVADAGFCRHVVEPYRSPTWSWAVSDDLILFVESARLGSSPSSSQLLGFSINPRVADNPYGEILSAELILKALTKPFVRSRQVISSYTDSNSIGSATFDEPAGPEDLVRMGYRSLFRMKTDNGDYVVSIITQPGSDSDWNVDVGQYFDDDYTLMLVHTDDNTEGDEEWANSAALCLILRQTTNDTHERYERVGFARIETPRIKWLETWKWQVLTLV